MRAIEKAERHILVKLFAGSHAGLMANAILEGQMGEALAIGDPPTSAVLTLPEFNLNILAGDPTHPDIHTYIKNLPNFSRLFLPSDEFVTLLNTTHPGKCVALERYAFSSKSLDIDHLESLKTRLPAEFQIKQIDLALAEQITTSKQAKYANHHTTNFKSLEDFIERGFGYCLVDGDRIACVASTFTVCQRGMEIQIDTDKAYRGKGLATVAAAYLIVHSLKAGIEPSWDAATKPSAKLAKKLGYTPEGTYHMHVYTGYRSLIYLRNFIQFFKKRFGK